MRKVLFGCLFFSFFVSLGQVIVTSPVDDIADTKSLRHAIANWDGFSEIILDVDKIVLDEDQGDILIPQGMCIKSTGKTTIKGDTTTYQHFRIGGYRMGNRPSIKPASVSTNTIVFEGITFTEFGNTPLYIVDYYVDLELKNCVFEKNIIMPAKNDPLVLNQSISDESRAAAIGVGNDLYSMYNVNSVVINNTDFIGNKGQGVGAVYLNQASLTIENVNFEGNEAKKYSYTSEGDGGPMSYTDGFGGAITVLGGQAILKNSIFKGNEAELFGGAVYQGSNGELTIDKCNFFDTKSLEEGGAIYTEEAEVTIDNSYFTGCSAVIGGVICARDGVFLELTNNTIAGNGMSILPEKGGVIFSSTALGGQNYGSNIKLTFNTIVNNKVTAVVDPVLSPNSAIIECNNEVSLDLTANIVALNSLRDLYSNKRCSLNGGNFIQKTINGTVYDNNNDNYIDASYVGSGLRSLTPTNINGSYVLKFKACGANGVNVLKRNVEDGLPSTDQLGNDRAVFTINGEVYSDAGAYELQKTQNLTVNIGDSILITSDTTKVLSDLIMTNDCNAKLTYVKLELENYDYESGGLRFETSIDYDSVSNFAFPKGNKELTISNEISTSELGDLLKNHFEVVFLQRASNVNWNLNYTITDNGGQTVTGTKVLKFPKYPELYGVYPYDVGVSDTIVLSGQNLDVTDRIKISPFTGEQEECTFCELRPTTQNEQADLIINDFINPTNSSISFVVPGLKAQQYSVELFNAYGTSYSGMTSGSEFSIELPKVDSFSTNKGRAGDTIFVSGDYLGGLDTITFVDGATEYYALAASNQIGSFNNTSNGSNTDSAWFILPVLAQAASVTAQVVNPAGGSINTPSITVLSDSIESFSFVDATANPFCLNEEVHLVCEPVGGYASPNDSVVLYGVVGNNVKEIKRFKVDPNIENTLQFKAFEPYNRLILKPKSNSNGGQSLTIKINVQPTIAITGLRHETCDQDSNGEFAINISGTVGVNYTTVVNNDTVTVLTQQNLTPGIYKIVSGFNGCNDSVSTIINPGSVNQELTFEVNAPVKACQDAYDVAFNVYSLTSPIENSDIHWEWETSGEAGFEDSITTYTPSLFPTPDSVTMITSVTTTGCFIPKTLTKETKIPFVKSPSVFKPGQAFTTTDHFICDSNEVFNVPFKSNTAGPFTLYYSYGDFNNSDTYRLEVIDTVFDLTYNYKKPGGVNSYYSGRTDSIVFNGCTFESMSTDSDHYVELKLIPTTDLQSVLSLSDESCFNGNNGSAKIDNNPDAHDLFWYTGSVPSTANQITNTSALVPGDYSLVVQDTTAGTCSDTVLFDIKKYTDEPSYDIVSEELCAGQDYQFKLKNITTNNIQSIDWKIGNNSITDPVNPTDTLSAKVKITNQMFGDTLFVTMNVNGCGVVKPYFDTLILNVNRDPNLSVRRNQTESVVSCDGIDFNTSYTLDSLINGTVWYKLNDIQNVKTNDSITINDSSFTINTLFGRGNQSTTIDYITTGSCSFDILGDTTTQLLGYNKPSVTNLQIQDEKCIGDSNGVLKAKSVGTLHWLNDKNLIISKQDTVSALAAGSYQVFATASTAGDCPSDTLDAVIKSGFMKDSVSFVLSGSDSVCSNLNLELGIASFKGKGTFTWTYNGSVIQSDTGSSYQLSQAIVSTSNTYNVVMTNKAVCKANLEYVVSGTITELTVPQKAVITGDASPICSTNPVFKVNKLQEDSIVWTVSPTGLDLDYHSGDSLSIYSLESSVQLFAKLESNEGCVGEISDVFAVKPQGCALSAALAVVTDKSGNAMDTVCRSNVFMAVNTSIGDYTSTKWKINDTVISTSSDTLRYDISKLPSGTYDLEIVVGNVAKKESITLTQAFTVVDNLPSQDILGNQYSCFGGKQAYYFNTKDLAIIQNATWSAINGTLKDSVFSGDSLITLFTPIDVNAQSGLALTLTSTCNEQKTYSKAIINFSEDLSVIKGVTSCADTANVVVPVQLVKPNYKISFNYELDSTVSVSQLNDSTYKFFEDGEYKVTFVDTISKCVGSTDIVMGTIPGFRVEDDTIYTKYNSTVQLPIYIDNNDAQFIDSSDYVIDRIEGISSFASVSLDTAARVLSYQVNDVLKVENSIDSLYYYATNLACVSVKAIDSAKVYIFISKPIDDEITYNNIKNNYLLDPKELLINDLYLDTIIFGFEEKDTLTLSGLGIVSSTGQVNYPGEYPEDRTDVVKYHSCRTDGRGNIVSGSCLASRTTLRFPSEGRGNGSSVDDGEAVSEGKDFFDLKVYNVVTPDGDGIHDYFKIILLEKETQEEYQLTSNIRSTLQIFTKWGDLVYESNNYVFDDESQFFRGKTEDGKDLPNGTYYYVYDLKITASETLNKKTLDLSKNYYNESGFLILKRP